MKYETRLEMLKLSDIVAAPYNPREDIERGSDEYKALRRSIELNGMVEPPVVNLHNMRCIGGNQRLVVLRDLGWEEVLCSVIDQPDESKEMKLCLALNRIEGRWDTDRLGELLRDDEVLEFETGFDRDEVLVYRQLGGDSEGEDADDDPDWDQDEDPDAEDADGEEEDEPAGGDDEPAMGDYGCPNWTPTLQGRGPTLQAPGREHPGRRYLRPGRNRPGDETEVAAP